MNKKKSFTIITILALVVSIGAVSADQAGFFNINVSNGSAQINTVLTNSTVTENMTLTNSTLNLNVNGENVTVSNDPTPAPKPTLQPTATPTPTPTQTPTSTPTPTPFPPLSFNVNVTEQAGDNRTFVCIVSVNDPVYNPVVNKLATENMSSILDNDPIWLGYIGIGGSGSVVSNVTDGQFTLMVVQTCPPPMSYGIYEVQRGVIIAFNIWLESQ